MYIFYFHLRRALYCKRLRQSSGVSDSGCKCNIRKNYTRQLGESTLRLLCRIGNNFCQCVTEGKLSRSPNWKLPPHGTLARSYVMPWNLWYLPRLCSQLRLSVHKMLKYQLKRKYCVAYLRLLPGFSAPRMPETPRTLYNFYNEAALEVVHIRANFQI